MDLEHYIHNFERNITTSDSFKESGMSKFDLAVTGEKAARRSICFDSISAKSLVDSCAWRCASEVRPRSRRAQTQWVA
jgi:hypothetical protein